MPLYPDAKVLDVNLTTGEIKTTIIPGETYRLYPGGSALGAYLIMREGMDPNIDPLSPDALLTISVSAFTGLPVAGCSRISVNAKSPLTGAFGDSQGGGFFPAQLRTNGWDSLLFRGASEKPVYLYIDNDKVELRDASFIWGKTTLDTENALKEAIGDDKVEIAEIGPGGENLVNFASIMSRASRAAGRNGMGAVMGSKKLKAIVLKRQSPRKVYDRENFQKFIGNVKERMETNPGAMGQKNGTGFGVEFVNNMGVLVTNNWQRCQFEDAEKITGRTMSETILVDTDNCYACPVKCKRVVSVPEKGVIPEYGGPEYETLGTLGSYCGIGDLGDVCLGNQLCNAYGLDTITCGATISWAMECYEKGLIDDTLTGGLKFNFGNGSLLKPVIEQIATKETEIGKLLAEGSGKASKILGKGSEKFFMGVKNQEFPYHMPQGKHSLGVHYSVNTYGADHQSVEHDHVTMAPIDSITRQRQAVLGLWKGYQTPYEIDSEKIRFVQATEWAYSLNDMLCFCNFVWGVANVFYGTEEFVPLAKFGLGVEIGYPELLLAAERKINMCRYFNYIAGFRPEKDDTLPDRLFEPLPEGPLKGHVMDREDWEKGKQMYYKLIGSDPETGRPTDLEMAKTSLDWLVDTYKK